MTLLYYLFSSEFPFFVRQNSFLFAVMLIFPFESAPLVRFLQTTLTLEVFAAQLFLIPPFADGV